MHNALVDPAPVLTYLEMSERAQFCPASLALSSGVLILRSDIGV
jgi:hypothetical protein